MPIYNWERDVDEIVKLVRINATLKLCTKTLDEPLLIEGWIQHHANIVGVKNLIIADNGSTDQNVLDVYAKYSREAIIFQFSGPHNEIHWHPRFQPLFDAIRTACHYFSFFDTDERLIWIDQGSWTADISIVDRLHKLQHSKIIPTTWLINKMNSFQKFSVLDSEQRSNFNNNLRWGKPILPSKLVGAQAGIHNAQFDWHSFSLEYGVGFCLLHYTQFPGRRIAVNRNKLISRGVINSETTLYEFLSRDFAKNPDQSFLRFVEEAKKMFESIWMGQEDTDNSDYIELGKDGKVIYSSASIHEIFSNFVSDGPALIAKILGNSPAEEDRNYYSSSLLRHAISLRDQGRTDRAERLFQYGVKLYPTFLDQYGGPAFRKELIRMLLARLEWSRAEELIPTLDDAGGMNWHHILFARALSQVGNKQAAEKWWRMVLEHEPYNGEAQMHLQEMSCGQATISSQPGK